MVDGISGEAVDVACGGAHTMCLTCTTPKLTFFGLVSPCNTMCTYAATGTVWAWGLNDEGQLGHQGDRMKPAMIKSFPSSVKIVRIACGAHHSAAINGTIIFFPVRRNHFHTSDNIVFLRKGRAVHLGIQ